MDIVRVVNGRVELRRENGSLDHIIGNGDATNAYWSGNEIVIQTYKGRTEIRKDNGDLIRMII